MRRILAALTLCGLLGIGAMQPIFLNRPALTIHPPSSRWIPARRVEDLPPQDRL